MCAMRFLVLEEGVVSLDTHYKLNLFKETELLLDNTSVRVAPSPSRHRTDARWRVWPVWT